MTQAQPPQVPVLPVSIPLLPMPQNWQCDKGTAGDNDVLWLTFVGPLTANVVCLDRDAALRLADDLREKAGGLQIVRDIPPANGRGDLGEFRR